MKGDFSRDGFDPRKSFSRVMMQQGRVQVDADWNEQASLTLSHFRTLARDLLGRGAGPASEMGFQVVTHASLPSPASGANDPFKEEREALQNGDLLLMPGRYYVGGLPLHLEQARLYSRQAGYPFDEATAVENLRGLASWLAYLDVWEDFVSADEDESIREPALGGIDSCGRGLIRWQVRILANAAKPEDFETIAERKFSRLKAFTDRGEAPDSSCIIAPGAGYGGAEDRLYRVEIHQGSDASGKNATFKWSRDNGSVTYPLQDLDDELLELVHLGRDETQAIAPKNWIELVDERWTGHDPAGSLAKVEEVSRDERRIRVKWAEPKMEMSLQRVLCRELRPMLRRWDHAGDVDARRGALAVDEGKDIELENGIIVHFEPGGTYRAGDYWLIPARVATGDVMWPGRPDNAEFLWPRGLEHFYAPLAFFEGTMLRDLRRKFDPVDKSV